MKSTNNECVGEVPEFQLTIGGERQAGPVCGRVFNPATGEAIATHALASPAELELAIASAKNAFPAWKNTSMDERRRLVGELSRVLIEHRDELVDLLVAEQGKTATAAGWEIDGSAHWCRGTALLDLPDQRIEMGAGQIAQVRHVPIGVVAAIVPWNFPILLAICKIAPALLAGNTVVLKPSPYTPLSTLRFGELTRRVLPPGVLNVIAIDDEHAQALTAHPDVGMITFTGSTTTGTKVMGAAAGDVKRISLELGGNDPAIVLPDADIESTVPALFWAAFQNSGQFCVATKRLYVHEAIYDRFCEALVSYAATVKVGNGQDPDTQLGPLQNQRQYEKVCGLIDDSKRAGHRFLLGGDVPEGPGFFVPVTIIDNPPDDARCVAEEAFGPVLPVLKYRTVDEAIRRANATQYGLAASVWGAGLDAASAVASRLEAGIVWINQIHVMGPEVPMGGVKCSGLGVGSGPAGLAHYCNLQTTLFVDTAANRAADTEQPVHEAATQ